MAAQYPKPRYGKEVLGKHLKLLSPTDGKWRTGTVSGYHGGYLRHTVTYDDNNESKQLHLYQEDYRFLSDDGGGPMPDLVQRTITITSNTGQKVTGEVLGYDGLMHTVQLPDDSLQHFNLRHQTYKVSHEHSTRERNTRRGSEPAPATQQQQEQESGGGSASKKQKQQTSPSNNSAGASGMSKAATYAANTAGSTGKDRKPGAAEPSSAVKAADGQHSKPPRRAAADRAAAVAVAVSMGSNGGSHGREDNNSSRRPAATPKSSTAAAAAAPSRRSAWEAAAEAGKKLPPLNMSHVSKKDREAARMLLTFSTPAAQEGTAAPLSETCRAGAGMPEGSGSRMAIAAVACAAAAAAGLPDPGAADTDEPVSPMQIDAQPMGVAPALAAVVAAAAAAAQEDEAKDAGNKDASSTAAAAAGAGVNGGGMDSAVLHEALSALQRQMQKLIAVEERRSVDIVRLNAKVARLQEERDEAFQERETAVAERDSALMQVQHVQDDNRALSTRVEMLQREVMQLQTHLTVEREMVGNLSLDAAALQMQLSSIRSELGCCKAESSHLLNQFRGVTGGDNSSRTDAAAATHDSSMAEDAAGVMMHHLGSGGLERPSAVVAHHAPPRSQQRPGRGRPRKHFGGAAGSSMRMDPAAAAALPVPADVITMQAGVGKQAAAMQPLMPFKAMTEARTLGVGQLMQVGPGKLVVGPRGWKPPVQPQAPQQTKAPGGRQRKRGRGFAGRMAMQKMALLQQQQQQQQHEEEEHDHETDREGSHPEPTSSDHTPAAADGELQGALLADAAHTHGPSALSAQQLLMQQLQQQVSEQQPHSSAEAGMRAAAPSAASSRDVTPAAAAAQVPQAAAAFQQPQLQQLQGIMQVNGNSAAVAAAAEAADSRSPTPDKQQQADQDNSNGGMANKKRKRDGPKAAVVGDADAAPIKPNSNAGAVAGQAGGELAAPAAKEVPSTPGDYTVLVQQQAAPSPAVTGAAAPPAAPSPAFDWQGGPDACAAGGAKGSIAAGIIEEAVQAAKRIKSEAVEAALPPQQQGAGAPSILQL